ncbi:endothelin-converting enzyme homolog [Acanthaster planci]|uniref:Endothelin-converting enzyme homolog n=1 Tax=Acanthaster planci TaxID=133434 RepID=A0A8B8A062_ACAPL|nr:endothelin-converting enzyme homolog [Acanthaster planci]
MGTVDFSTDSANMIGTSSMDTDTLSTLDTEEQTSSQGVVIPADDETVSRNPWKWPIIIAGAVVLLFVVGAVFFTIRHRPVIRFTCVSAQCNESAILVQSSVDSSQDPCQNFFDYACGGWNKRQVIPGDKLRVSILSQLHDDLQEKLRGLIERDPQLNEPASFSQVRKYYNACLDQDTINSLGATPLINVLDSVHGWPVLGSKPGGNWLESSYHFERLWATLSSQFGINAIISTGVHTNIRNSREHILKIKFPAFTAPSEFLSNKRKLSSTLIPENLSNDFGRHLLLLSEFESQRAAYLRYMVDIAVALGGDQTEARKDMSDVLEFEKTLARHADYSTTRDVPEITTLEELQLYYTKINWANLYHHLIPSSVQPPVLGNEPIVVVDPSYLYLVNTMLGSESHRVVANYMIWRLVSVMVPSLGDRYTRIYQKYLHATFGLSEARARWMHCTDETNLVLPFATGRMYVDEYFTLDTKREIEQIISNIRRALRAMQERVSWLSYSDRAKTQKKLDAMKVNVGYPDWLKVNATLDAKSADLVVTSNTYFINFLNYLRREAQRKLGSLRLPVDKSLWIYTAPADTNAFYSFLDNGIVIPAGILQPPVYHPDLPWYSNYAGVGAIIGHEITHGFDSKGRLFDKDGNFKVWWSYMSVLDYVKAANCLVDQYSDYVIPENGKNLNGKRTEAENTADNGGLREAYKAYEDNAPYVRKQLPGLQNLTDEQMFFLSYAQVWCGVTTRAGADQQVKLGVHSPNRFRVIGPLQNNEDFTSAFNCPLGSYMRRSPRCKVWY